MAVLPEQQARQTIDAMLAAAGWAVQDYKAFDPSASFGIALREVPLKSGRCDYLLLVNRKRIGVVEVKNQGIIPPLAEQTRIVAEVERPERGGRTGNRRHHQPPTRHPPPAVGAAKCIRGRILMTADGAPITYKASQRSNL